MAQHTQRIAMGVLSFALATSLMLPTFAASFVDVGGHWAQQSIENLSQQGIINGYPTGEFRPEGQVTRAEFATMLVKALRLNPQGGGYSSGFVDVPNGFWASPAIRTVSQNGLVSGYPGGYFRPNQNISRAEAMAVLVKAARVPLPNPQETAQILQNYSDAYQIPQWAAPSVAAAIRTGIFANYPSANLIEPNTPATRAQIAVMTDHFQNVANNPNLPNTTGSTATNPYQQQPNTTTGGYTSGSMTQTQQNDTLRGRVSVVPPNTIFSAVTTQPFSSDRSQVGDTVTLTLDRPILSAAGEIVVPQGSQVSGRITQITPAARAIRNGAVTMDFNQIRTPDGRTFAISAEVNAENGALVAGTTKGRLGKAAIHTLGGAAIGGAAGAVIGRLTDKDKTNEGLMWGSILGAGLGAGSAAASKGSELVVPAGDILELKLRQPLTVTSTTP